MANETWITVNPNESSDTKQLTITGTPNYGRDPRSAVLNLSGSFGSQTVQSSNSLLVTQYGSDPYLTLVAQTGTISNPLPNTAGTISYSGYSNLQSFTVDLSQSNGCSISSVTMNQISSGSEGVTVSGSTYTLDSDAGKTERYPVTIVFSVPANSGTSTRTCTIRFTGTPAMSETNSVTFYQVGQNEGGGGEGGDDPGGGGDDPQPGTEDFGFALNGVIPEGNIQLYADETGTRTDSDTVSVVAPSGTSWQISVTEETLDPVS